MEIQPYESNQQVFEIVVKHLLKQNQSSTIDGDFDSTCAYRSGDGLSCAVGCLIPDEIYKKDFENILINDLLNPHIHAFYDVDLAKLFKNIDVSLLRELQRIHDNHLPETWESSLKFVGNELGEEYNIHYPENIQ